MDIKLFDSELKIMNILWQEGDMAAKNIAKQANLEGMKKENIKQLETIEEAIEWIKKQVKKGDAILIKASNGMNFKKIVESIK